LSDADTISITVYDVNRPPVLTDIGNLELNESEEFILQLEAVDPDGDNLTFEAENLPEGSILEGDVFSWTPGDDQSGIYPGVIFRVWDDGDPRMSGEESITITVGDVNRPPVLTDIGDLELNEGGALNLLLEAVDPDGDSLFFEAENLPEGSTIQDDMFIWMPSYDQAGVYVDIVFRVWDNGEPRLSDEDTISITVYDVNRPPVLTDIGNLVLNEGEEFILQLEAVDPDGDNLTFEDENLPEGSILEGDVFSWTPGDDQSGIYPGVIFRVWDDGDPRLSDEKSVTITVGNVNRPPVLTDIGDLELNEGEEFILQLEAVDPDGNNLDFEADNLPEGSTLLGSLFSWTPGFEQAGVYADIIFRVWDDGEPRLSDADTISITVNDINRPPVLTDIGDLELNEGGALNLQLEAFDPDGDNLVFEVDNPPEGSTIQDDLFIWMPSYDQAGVYDGVILRVWDDGDPRLSDADTISITVYDVNQPPILIGQIGNVTIDEDPEPRRVEIADLDTIFSDPDGDELTFDFSGADEKLGMEIDEDNILFISPEDNFNIPEGAEISVIADDEGDLGMSAGIGVSRDESSILRRDLHRVRNRTPGRDETVETSFILTIDPVNDPPEWVIPPLDVDIAATDWVNFTVEAMDVDEDAIVIEASSDDLPEGWEFIFDGDVSGVFNWQTVLEDDGDYSARFMLTDGEFVIDSTISIHVDSLRDMTIELNGGWNMISLNIDPLEEYYSDGEDRGPDVWLMIEQLRIDEENHRVIILKDGRGNFCSPHSDFSNIPYWNRYDGYYIKVIEDCAPTWTGIPILPFEDLPVDGGWNLSAYFPNYELSADHENGFYVLSSIIDHVIMAKNGMGEFMRPEYEYSGMSPWIPGEGYQILVDEDVVLNYPEPLDILGALFDDDNPIQTPWDPPIPTGSNMSVLITDISGLTSNIQHLILAYGIDGRLVGQSVVEDNICGLVVWGDDPATERVDGLLDGEAFELRIWNALFSEEWSLTVTSVENGCGLVYETDSFVSVETAVEDEIQEKQTAPDTHFLSNAYPNPFNSVTKISFGLAETGYVSIRVFDLSGRPVETLIDGDLSAGGHVATWDGSDALSGIYLVRMQTVDFVKVRKVVLVR
ncbi:T9SS type A sorting domain-containing protein, partial [bacterium]|nr:T9SS type A sorting domain-containing protein [bacterium]